ncbi:alpha/beta fold hydrolase [Fibrella aquatica]|uniref:alpha/beta fold hydrolase n=1 Tax=Fibrella aquatica TaxID=3242487 RepID=UPI003522B879
MNIHNHPILVFLHGHGVSPVIWDSLYSSLASDYKVVRPNYSLSTSHTSIDGYAETLQGQLRLSGLGSYILIGHSMGGYIALAMAEKYPDCVKGVVLFNSTAFADVDSDQQRQKRQDAKKLLQTEGGKAFVEKTIPTMFSDPESDLVNPLVEAHVTLPTDALLAGLEAIRTRPDRSAFLQRADFPVLIIAGRYDKAIPFERSEELHKKVPNAEFAILDQSGHMGMLEEPENSLNVLKSFLDKIPAV